MRKYSIIKKITEQEQKILNYIECDICHKIYKISDNEFEIYEFFSFNTEGGYASVFGDEEKIQIDICQHCMKNWLDKHKQN